MSLKTRFILIACILIATGSLAMWYVSQLIAEKTISQWGRRIATIQVRYDSGRLLQTLERETALARQMAESTIIKRWIGDPDDPALKTQAIAEMESYRRNFLDKSYFVALLDSGAYYHNNAGNDFAGSQLRYHLDRNNPADAWFYSLIDNGRDFHLNVNPDEELGVTKLWIDVLIRDGGKVLGILGTGLNLQTVLDDIVDIGQAGITTLFLDYQGAIQLYRDKELIDYGSINKNGAERNTIGLLLTRNGDRERMREMMQELAEAQQPKQVDTAFVNVQGKRHLLGVSYLPEIGWYEVTLMDLDALMPVRQFLPVVVVFVLVLLVVLLLFFQFLYRLVLNPVAALEEAMVQVRTGSFEPASLPRAQGEIRRLIDHFATMAAAIRNHTMDLEEKIRLRTDELDRLARIDSLTGLLNRRGMTDLLAEETARAARNRCAYGILWLDVDNFKQINDTHGHNAGDLVLTEIARLIKTNIRPYDHAARWGGDEFLAVLAPCDDATLKQIGERIRIAIETGTAGLIVAATVSIGGCLARSGDKVDLVLKRADTVLYEAKAAGRNSSRFCATADAA